MRLVLAALSFLTAVACGGGGSAAAADRIPSHCIAVADAAPLSPERIWRADWRDPVPADSVRIRYIDHAMFLIQTPGGLSAVTDYTGHLGSVDFVPDVATMNHAHSSHWTQYPDPRIPHLLPGWGPYGKGIDYWLDLGDMLVRNISTDIRFGFSGAEPKGNSIFVFETAGLCIAHLSHLHEDLTDSQYAALGRVDVLMVPVDGGWTLDLPTMEKLVRRLHSSVVIPMHWFTTATREDFIAGLSGSFDLVRVGGPEIVLSLRSLPRRPTIMLLTPKWLQ